MNLSLKKTHYHHGGLRDALITQGLTLLDQEGCESLSLSLLSQTLGVSKAAPYRHFTCKNDLLLILAASGFQKLQFYLNQAWWEDHISLEKIQEIGQAYVKFSRNHSNLYRLMFSFELKGKKENDELQNERKKAYFVLNNATSRFLRLNRVETIDTTQAAITFWSSLHGLSMFMLDSQLSFVPLTDNQIIKSVTGLVARIFQKE